MAEYFRATGDPERGWALAALTGGLVFREAKPQALRDMARARVDGELFDWSYDFVGDLAETVALIWPETADPAGIPGAPAVPSLTEIVSGLRAVKRGGVPDLLAPWLDALDATGRWALLKLVTGALRVGVSARLAKTALAEAGGVALDAVEEIWHGLAPPYAELFDWAFAGGARPHPGDRPVFLPLMLANPIEPRDFETLDPADYLAEWKWDGIRVQLSGSRETVRIWSRSGDDITPAFPDVAGIVPEGVVLDGELLAGAPGNVLSFNDLQQRLNRKTPTPALLAQYPTFVRLYDILKRDGTDLRPLPLFERRARLEAWYREGERPGLDLSPIIPFVDWAELGRLRDGARAAAIEGLMLKRRDAAYVPGRPKGRWFKWKREALVLDCVLMYAQRGHGKRSSFYSDYTFGAWRGPDLVPVGKAYSGFTDQELAELDRWVRANTVRKYGPVREVTPGLVLEIAFDAVQRSSRHKSGLAMRFPRVHRIRWDKPAAEADTVEALQRLMG